jgi:hypothetical protein
MLATPRVMAETGDNERETGVIDSVGHGAAMWLPSSD